MAEATQTKTTIAIDPVTRIEGHLKAEVVVENGKVVDAKLTGGMYRGFESILRGRHPRDAAQIVQHLRRVPHRPCHRRQHRVGKSQRHRGSEQRPRHP
ncbi:MAG: hypothetical protein ACLSTO_02095 [Bilophila wadsworthia]